jgi:hypothetical protein
MLMVLVGLKSPLRQHVPGAQMPVHLLHSGDDQAIVLLVIIFGALCARRWHITRAVVTALLIGAGLISLTVIVDLYILHQIAGYLTKLGHIIG